MEPADAVESTTRYLLTRHHSGDHEALGQLLARELSTIRDLVRRRLGGVLRQRLDTGDVVQEVCLHLLQKGPRFVVRDPACFRRLMARLVSNQIVSMYRRYGPAAERERNEAASQCIDLDAVEPSSPGTSPPDRAARQEEREWIRLALLLMEPIDAEVLRLRDEVDESFVQIALRLDMQPDAVRMRFKRALQKLERCVLQLRLGRVDALIGELESQDERTAAPGS